MKKQTVDVAALVVEALSALTLAFVTGYTVGRSVHDFILGGGDFAYQCGEPRLIAFIVCVASSFVGSVLCAVFVLVSAKQMYPRRIHGGGR